MACEAYEILGRAARERDLVEAASWFTKAAGLAERHGLTVSRARALHELATISQLRTLQLDDLQVARQAALEAGAAGLLSAVDFHIAAIHGVRFEPEQALAAARCCLDESRRLGVVRQQAWGWILIGQAHACAGRRAAAAAAAGEAQQLAPDDAEIAGLAWGTCRGLASLLAGDRERTVSEFRIGVEKLRPLPRIPLPPWYCGRSSRPSGPTRKVPARSPRPTTPRCVLRPGRTHCGSWPPRSPPAAPATPPRRRPPRTPSRDC